MVACVTRKQVLVQLDTEQIEALDGLASTVPDSRSELIRRAIALYLTALEQHVADVRYADAYRSMPESASELEVLRALATTAWPVQ
jgi:metal-responsive CopG/Arc/MetJ family transcriptional regulator